MKELWRNLDGLPEKNMEQAEVMGGGGGGGGELDNTCVCIHRKEGSSAKFPVFVCWSSFLFLSFSLRGCVARENRKISVMVSSSSSVFPIFLWGGTGKHICFPYLFRARRSSEVERSLMVRWVVGSILHELFLVPASAPRLV